MTTFVEGKLLARGGTPSPYEEFTAEGDELVLDLQRAIQQGVPPGSISGRNAWETTVMDPVPPIMPGAEYIQATDYTPLPLDASADPKEIIQTIQEIDAVLAEANADIAARVRRRLIVAGALGIVSGVATICFGGVAAQANWF